MVCGWGRENFVQYFFWVATMLKMALRKEPVGSNWENPSRAVIVEGKSYQFSTSNGVLHRLR
jgi:hypothetical protein